MRVGFAGTPEFAARALAAIAAAGYTIPLVLTQPDRPHGRGLHLAPSPVKDWATRHGLVVAQPSSLRTPEARAPLVAVPLDVLVVAAYGLILPQAVLDWPRFGCLNIHASKLPRWRGAAPIQRAIEAGDVATGVTIMRMDSGLDTGPMIATVDVPVAANETAPTLADKLSTAGAAAIVDVLARLARDGRIDTVIQPAAGVTYAAKIGPADAAADWSQPAAVLERRIRAFGQRAMLGETALKLRAAQVLNFATEAAPGTVIAAGDAGIDVACAGGTLLRLTDVQPAGGKPMPAAAFLRGRPIVAGTRFDPAG